MSERTSAETLNMIVTKFPKLLDYVIDGVWIEKSSNTRVTYMYGNLFHVKFPDVVSNIRYEHGDEENGFDVEVNHPYFHRNLIQVLEEYKEFYSQTS